MKVKLVEARKNKKFSIQRWKTSKKKLMKQFFRLTIRAIIRKTMAKNVAVSQSKTIDVQSDVALN